MAFPIRLTLFFAASAALFSWAPCAHGQAVVEHAWMELGSEVRERRDISLLRGPFRPALWGTEPVAMCALGTGDDPAQEPLPGAPFELSIQRIEVGGLHPIPGLEAVRMPSGPFPALHRQRDATLLASSAHLLWIAGHRTRQLDAPWGAASRSPVLFGDADHCFALVPDGSIWRLKLEEQPQSVLPRGSARVAQACFAAPDRLLWIDELGWLNAVRLAAEAAPTLLFQRALPVDVEAIATLTARDEDTVIATADGRLLWYRGAELRNDIASDAWPRVDVATLALRSDGTLEVADRCGWITTISPAVPSPSGEAEAADPSPAHTRWIDGFLAGWPRTLRAVALDDGWLLQREHALIAVRGGRAVELRSGALPFGLSRPDARVRDLPWSAIPDWILPRTIRAVSPASKGLWVLTSSSIDLFASRTERILERHTLASEARSDAWRNEPLSGFAGGLVIEDGLDRPESGTDFFLRAPADRELVHLRVSKNGSSELERFTPGPNFPPPPYGGMATNAAGELLIATRRGLWWKAPSMHRFERVEAEGHDALARCDDVVPMPDGSFLVLANGRAFAWRAGWSIVEAWAVNHRFTALTSTRGLHAYVAATDGHQLFDLKNKEARAWPCPPTPKDAEVRSFARVDEQRGPFFVLDRENRVWRSDSSRWHTLDVREPLSDASHFTTTADGALYLHLDASLWRLDESGGPRRVLEYRAALARWIDQRGLRNVNFAFGALIIAVLVFALLGGFLLPKGPIPIASAPARPWRVSDAILVLAIFLIGQLAVDQLLRFCDLEDYPVFHAALSFSVPGLIAVIAMRWLLHRRYERGFEAIGVPHVPTAVAVQQVLVGVLMVVPVSIIAGGISSWLNKVGAPTELLVQEMRPQIPVGDLERLGIFLCMAVIAPLVEELIFRGFVQNIFVERLGPPLGILATALLFAWLHPAGGYAPLFVLALALGLARQATGSLHVCIGLHLAQNFVPALATAVGS